MSNVSIGPEEKTIFSKEKKPRKPRQPRQPRKPKDPNQPPKQKRAPKDPLKKPIRKPAKTLNPEAQFFKLLGKNGSKLKNHTSIIMIPNSEDHKVHFPVGSGISEATASSFWSALNDWRIKVYRNFIFIFF